MPATALKEAGFSFTKYYQYGVNDDVKTIHFGAPDTAMKRAFGRSAVGNLMIVAGSIVLGYTVGKVPGAVAGGILGIAIVMNAAVAAELPNHNIIPPPNSKIPYKKLTDANPLLDNADSIGTSFPVLGSFSISAITDSTAICTGNVLNQGASPVVARGICWGTASNPTIAGNKTNVGPGIGGFSSDLIGLKSNTLYYVRVYATNNTNISYGPVTSFKTKASLDTAAVLVSHGTWTSTNANGNIVLNFSSNGTGVFQDYINSGGTDPVTTTVIWQYIPALGILRVTTLDDWFDWSENDIINYKITSFSETEMKLLDLASPTPWNYTFN